MSGAVLHFGDLGVGIGLAHPVHVGELLALAARSGERDRRPRALPSRSPRPSASASPDVCWHYISHYICGQFFDPRRENAGEVYAISLPQAPPKLLIQSSVNRNVYGACTASRLGAGRGLSRTPTASPGRATA